VVTTLAAASTSVADWLEWSERVGPLSGKTIVAVFVWLVAWGTLHLLYRNRPFETRRALVISLVLIGLGVIGTFPEFFQLFAPD
jgi:heme A synthase